MVVTAQNQNACRAIVNASRIINFVILRFASAGTAETWNYFKTKDKKPIHKCYKWYNRNTLNKNLANIPAFVRNQIVGKSIVIVLKTV